jgi:hypothetical protein
VSCLSHNQPDQILLIYYVTRKTDSKMWITQGDRYYSLLLYSYKLGDSCMVHIVIRQTFVFRGQSCYLVTVKFSGSWRCCPTWYSLGVHLAGVPVISHVSSSSTMVESTGTPSSNLSFGQPSMKIFRNLEKPPSFWASGSRAHRK